MDMRVIRVLRGLSDVERVCSGRAAPLDSLHSAPSALSRSKK